MEFEAIDGQIVYRGLSLFQVAKNAYTGNVLASEEEKEEMLQSYVSYEQLEAISQHVCEVMQPALKGVYSGPFGVDMMVCAKSPEARMSLSIPASNSISVARWDMSPWLSVVMVSILYA